LIAIRKPKVSIFIVEIFFFFSPLKKGEKKENESSKNLKRRKACRCAELVWHSYLPGDEVFTGIDKLSKGWKPEGSH
jgi:hypothetical protein